MESSNSGSIPSSSSSGDNDKYDDSRGESISSFSNLPPPHPPPPPTADATLLLHHPSSSSSIFDPLSPYLASFPFPLPEPNSLNLDSPWPKSTTQPCSLPSYYSTCTTLEATIAAALSSEPESASASTTRPSPVQPPLVRAARSPAAAPRGSKKRSRASRRAPTTVLATDTSNFRAMVQQFTGFPTPPFTSSSSPFPRPRLDLFNMGTAAVPTYLLRPFPQKTHTTSFAPMTSSSSPSSSSSALEAIASFTRGVLSNVSMPIATSSSSSAASSSSTGKCQLSFFDAQHSKPLDSTMQLLLQPEAAPKYNSHALPTMGGRPQGPSAYAAMGGPGILMATEVMNSTNRSADAVPGWIGSMREDGRAQNKPE